jgi:hypothetical protein
MQLRAPERPATLRSRLSAAACLVLASGAARGARAAVPADSVAAPPPMSIATAIVPSPRWQLDLSGLVYGEKARTRVVEPIAKITRLYAGGQSLSARLALDAMTGASPSGAQPSGRVQTVTSASGTVTTRAGDVIPTTRFNDFRGGLDLEWVRPLGGHLTATAGAEASREKDYRSLGANGKLELQMMNRLTTLTVGGGMNDDGVFPIGGTPVGLTSGLEPVHGTQSKQVRNALFGVSRVLTRRWLLGVSVARERDRGYLTEPYKVVSLIGPDSGYTVGELAEKRPGSRTRTSVLGSSVYHLAQDVLYTSYRWYHDDWGITSHTVDLRLRHELGDDVFVQPHLRGYAQTAADFFRFGLRQGDPVPEFASSDERLGPLRTVTAGATVGFHLPDTPGTFSVRGELLVQWGRGHPPDAIGIQRGFDLMPPVPIGTLTVGYTRTF